MLLRARSGARAPSTSHAHQSFVGGDATSRYCRFPRPPALSPGRPVWILSEGFRFWFQNVIPNERAENKVDVGNVVTCLTPTCF